MVFLFIVGMYTISYLQIEPTNACNLDCEHCCRKTLTPGMLSLDTVKNLVEQCPDLQQVVLQGEGEPFINKEIFDMISFLKNKAVQIEMVSNAQLLSGVLLDKLKVNHPDTLLFSLESTRKEEYEHIRKNASFEKFINNVKAVTAIEGMETGLAFTFLKSNIDQVELLFSLADSLGVSTIRLQKLLHLASYTAAYDNTIGSEYLSQDDVDFLMTNIEGLKKEYPHINVRGYLKSFPACPFVNRGMYIQSDGQITPCCFIKSSTVVNRSFGHIDSEKLVDLFNSDKYHQLRNDVKAKKSGLCNNCEFMCGGN